MLLCEENFPMNLFALDGEAITLSKEHTFYGHSISWFPRKVSPFISMHLIFPYGACLEKIAVNLLAGVPAIVKPATITSYLTEAVVREIIASGILPEGALQLICGSAGDLLDHVCSQDVVRSPVLHLPDFC